MKSLQKIFGLLLLTFIIVGCANSRALTSSPSVEPTLPTLTAEVSESPLMQPVIGTSDASIGDLSAGSDNATPDTPLVSDRSPKVITMEDNQGTIVLQAGDELVLSLKPGYDWTLEIADDAILESVERQDSLNNGEGYFVALKPGKTELIASGDAPCRKVEPPCAMPSLLFRIQVIVE
jgi:hypothetical protein